MHHTKADQKWLSRNFPIVKKSEQKKLSQVTLAFFGCGLGSNIAVLAARTGIRNFILMDGDRVEMSNLNRQSFFIPDIGKNKALALKKHLLNVNKKSNVQVIGRYITKDSEIYNVVKHSDVIIDTADFSKSFFSISNECVKQGKLVIAPFNVGFGSVVTSFHKPQKEKTLNDLTGLEFLLGGAKKYYNLPGYFKDVFKQILQKRIPYTPQIGIASSIASSITMKMILDYIRKDKIPTYPRVKTVDLN